MWIAKPLRQLSDLELRQWIHVCAWQRRAGADVPLAQTLTWNGASKDSAVAVEAFAVFSSQENVGGIVLQTGPAGSGRFECINGPLLDWDRADRVPRQLATFAMAVSRLSGAFESLVLRPRWRSGESERRLAQLPVESRKLDRAATLVLDLNTDWQGGLTQRLKRTLVASAQSLVDARVCSVPSTDDPQFVGTFSENMTRFGHERGFVVPSADWLRKLVSASWVSAAENIRFLRSSATVGESGRDEVHADLLIAVHGGVAHYLFGCERRSSKGRGAWSAQAVAQFEALRACADSGLVAYDLNGYVRPEDRDLSHPYARVAEFKSQWGGRVIDYEVPEIVIR